MTTSSRNIVLLKTSIPSDAGKEPEDDKQGVPSSAHENPDNTLSADLPEPQVTDKDGKIVPEERSNYPLWAFRNVMGLLGLTTALNTIFLNNFPDLTVAFLASTLYTVLLHPLETCKTRVQLQLPVLEHGIPGLYNGLGWGVLKEGLTKSLWMSAFIAFSSAPFHLINPVGMFLAGAMAVLISSFMRVPFEFICKRRQAGIVGRTSLQEVRTMFRQQNWQLSVSWMALTLRDLQTLAFSVAIFCRFEEWVPIFINSPVPIVMQLVGWASLCAAVAALPSAASDTVTTELMTESPGQVDVPLGPDRSNGSRVYGLLGMAERIVVAFRELHRAGGMRRLWQGWLLRFLHAVFSTFIFISTLVALTAYPQQFQALT